METPPAYDTLKIERTQNEALTALTVYRNQKNCLTFDVYVTQKNCQELLDAMTSHMAKPCLLEFQKIYFANDTDEYFFEFNPVDMSVYNEYYGLKKSEPRIGFHIGYPNPKRKRGYSTFYFGGTKKQIFGELYRFILQCFPDMRDTMFESLLETDLVSYYERMKGPPTQLEKEVEELIAELTKKVEEC